jgi:general secretion pathway protein G
MELHLSIQSAADWAKGDFMAQQSGSFSGNIKSRNKSSAGKIKTSAAALWSLICSAAGLIVFSMISPAMDGINESARIIIGLCPIVCFIFSMSMGIVGLVRIHKSAGRLEGSFFAITGLALSIALLMLLFTCPIEFTNKIEAAKKQNAKIQIAEFERALQSYAKDNGSLPTNEQGLEELANDNGKGQYLRKHLPNDPWGRPYHYRNPGIRFPSSYDLWSDGTDGIEGTADDITNRK